MNSSFVHYTYAITEKEKSYDFCNVPPEKFIHNSSGTSESFCNLQSYYMYMYFVTKMFQSGETSVQDVNVGLINHSTSLYNMTIQLRIMK